MAEQRQQPSRFKFIWGGAGSVPPTRPTPPIRRQPIRQPQPPPSSQSRPPVQPRGGASPPASTSSAPITTASNATKETKNEEKKPPSISKTTDSSQKSETKEVSKLASQESLKPASTSQPDPASAKPDLPERKSSTFEAGTSPNNHPVAHEQTTIAKEPALLVPQETTTPTSSSLEKTQIPTPTSAEPSTSTSDVAQKTESSTTKEPALLIPQKAATTSTSSPDKTQNPTPTSIFKSEVAQKTESSTTKEPALLVPQESTNPTTSSPEALQKPIPSIESSISTSPSISEEKPTQPKPKSESETIRKETSSDKLPIDGKKTLLSATGDVIKIVRESDHKITNSSIGGDRLPPTKKETKEGDHISSLVKKTGLDNPKYPIEGKQVTVITLAGENRGASMQLGSDAAKEAIQIHRGYKMNQSEDTNNTNDNKSKETKSKDDDNEGPIMRTLINSNVQSINNSILLNSSVSKRDPGVQFAFPRVLRGEEESVKSTFDARKMQFEATPSHQVAYEPRIRRRCLKGLLMESSESESDNPGKKNRRHGCRYVCGEKESNSEMHIQIN